jgi:NAD(P)-dependent dehydrogenase (short-subunit alcohol dehydrogenase family)
MPLLEGKIALITGGAVGTSRGIARALAREGAGLILADIDGEGAERTAEEFREGGARAFSIATDVAEREQVWAAVEAARERFGGLDILVNTAIRLSPDVPLEQKTDEMVESVFRVGFWGVLWMMQAALPLMRQRGGGRIINFYSNDADAGVWLHSDYNATKGAVLALSRSAAIEWARYGILVNCISPNSQGKQYEILVQEVPGIADQASARNPLGRIGDPEEDIGPLVAFLASDGARYITGDLIRVDGGQHLPRRDSRPADLTTFET